MRTTEVDHLRGDSTKARSLLGWKPQLSFEQLVKITLDHDLEQATREQTLTNVGHRVVVRGTAHA